MKNNVETLEVFLAVMKLGALPVPINHRFKGEEVIYVLEDSNPQTAIVDEFGADTIADIHDHPDVPVETFLYVGEGSAVVRRRLRDGRDERVGCAGRYRSRTERRRSLDVHERNDRKAERVHLHARQSDHACGRRRLRGDHIEQGNRHMIITPLFHVGAFVPFITNFYAGGTTIVVDGFDPEQVLDYIEAESINSSYFVPTQSRQLLAVDGLEEYDFSSFESYGTGAAPSGPELKREIIETFETDLVESFGQTEALSTRLPPDRTIDKAESVGRPALNLEMKVVDSDGSRVPRGEIGRAGYKGPSVFAGYHGMPEKTAEVFDEDGWFISDDLIRRDEEGFVYFVGRADDMIVSGGENIHPTEIEEVLHEHPAVDEVAIVGVPDETWGERVKAAIVPREETSNLDEEEIVSYVEERIASYKKPREVEFRTALPRNPTGKVLKGKLK